MEQKNHFSLIQLEYDKILALLCDCAVTDGGKALCGDLTPCGDAVPAELLLKETDEALRLLYRRGEPSFYGVKDICASLDRASVGATIGNSELLSVAYCLKAARKALDYIDKEKDADLSITSVFLSLIGNKFLEDEIFRCIISPEEIADNASDTLFSIRKSIRGASSKIRDILQKYCNSQTYRKYLQDPIVTVRSDRFVIPVKAEHKNDIKGLVHDTSASGATLFIEPDAAVDANNEIKVLRSQEKDEIERILSTLSALVGDHSLSIKSDYETLIKLDFVFAKGKLAKSMKAVCPNIHKDKKIVLKNARHPLIPADKVVPISISLGENYRVLVITGPNTGGKTVTLKTVGLISLMAQSGLLIPADEGSTTSVFQSIYADIGDEQSIEQSLSTFSSHLKTIINITDNVDSGALVLFDELGSGTDPVEGAALAVSILEFVRGFGACAMATTHYSELKKYALETAGVENASCEFDVETLKPTYKVITGIPGKSNAFEICYKLGLNQHIIATAKSNISDENRSFENVIAQMEEKKQQLEKDIEKARLERDEAMRISAQLTEQKDELEKTVNTRIAAAKNTAYQIVENAKSRAEGIINDIAELRRTQNKEELQKSLEVARNILKTSFNKLSKKYGDGSAANDEGQNKLPRTLVKGDNVKVRSLNKNAIVTSDQGDKNFVFVAIGTMNSKINVSDLDLCEKPKEKTVTPVTSKNLASRSGALELDIRGYTVLDAELEVEKFIDHASLMGIGSVVIIHGKGTGALRAAVHQLLKRSPQVRTFRLGVFGEGEMGVTIVEIK